MLKLKRYIKKTIHKLWRMIRPSMHKWPKKMLITYTKRQFLSKMGYEMNLDNPTTFAEKLQWYKIYYRNPELKNILDKYNFKQYIADRLGNGHTIELYGVWDNVKKLRKSWMMLPESFVIKSTVSGNGEHMLIIRHKSDVDFRYLQKEFKRWLNPKHTNMNTTLTGYYDCSPRIIAERYVENVADQLYDYKIYCFSGEPYTICASINHFTDAHYPITYYDLEWNKLNVQSGEHKNDDIEKPYHIEKMIDYARILSTGFPFVRVDFFDTQEKLYLAEMTFYPGTGYVRYKPEEFNRKMGGSVCPSCS